MLDRTKDLIAEGTAAERTAGGAVTRPAGRGVFRRIADYWHYFVGQGSSSLTRRIVFLNGHYDNTYAIAYACAAAASAGRLPDGVDAFPVNYWDGMTPEEAGEFFGPTAGLHANRAETSAVMAIDERFVDLDAANAELPPFPEVTNAPAVHTAFFFSAPGSVHRATHSGTWGDARESSADYGERYLEVVTAATIRVLDDIERTFAAMPPR